MTQVVAFQNEYKTLPELLDRIGYIKGMIDYLQFREDAKRAREDFINELFDRELELIAFIAQLDQSEDMATVIFRTSNFGLVSPNIARDLWEKYHMCAQTNARDYEKTIAKDRI